MLTLASDAGGASLLTPDGSLLVVLLMFLAFVPVLNKLLFVPVSKVLAERDRLTRGSSRDAENILNTIEHKLSEYEDAIRSARADGYKYIEAQRAAAAAERQATIDAARSAAESRIGEAKSQLRADADSARESLLSEATHIAARISSTLLGREVKGGQS